MHIIQSVLKVLVAVDLDPCSNSSSHPNIPAKKVYTKEENGLSQQWKGRIFLNPPYGRDIICWFNRLHHQYKAGNVVEAIALLPARTDTAWFRVIREYPRCFIHGRLKFGGAKSSAPFPSVVVYLGPNEERFEQVFSQLGDVYALVDSRRNTA